MSNKIYIIRWSEIDSSGEAYGGVTTFAYYDIETARKELEDIKQEEIQEYIDIYGYDEDYVRECTHNYLQEDGFIIKTADEQTEFIIEEMEVK